MLYTKPIEFTSVDEVLNNFEPYKNTFIQDGLLLFRNANLNNDQHKMLHEGVKKEFGCLENDTTYVENHEKSERRASAGPDEIFLDWHVEHPYYIVPIILGTWNMYKFKTDPENGKTYFVDMELLFKTLPSEEQEFLIKCVEENAFINGKNNLKNEHKIIGYHWFNDNPVIRTAWIMDEIANVKLKTFDGKLPNDEQRSQYKKLLAKIKEEVLNNTDIRIVHKWQQGDLLMVDIYKMCHAVTGGFDPADREFAGMWGFYNHPRNN